jgi:hypothetical protein
MEPTGIEPVTSCLRSINRRRAGGLDNESVRPPDGTGRRASDPRSGERRGNEIRQKGRSWT